MRVHVSAVIIVGTLLACNRVAGVQIPGSDDSASAPQTQKPQRPGVRAIPVPREPSEPPPEGTQPPPGTPPPATPPPSVGSPGGLLSQGELVYQGAFKLPEGFEYAAHGSVFNLGRNSLFITGGGRKTAEIAVPEPSASTDLGELPTAAILQPLTDVSEGTLNSVGTDVLIGGYLIYNNQLYFNGYVYYDANGSQRMSHWRRSMDLRVTGRMTGPFGIHVAPWNVPAAGLVSGPMTLIPPEWRAQFGGPAMTSQCCIPIITRTSYGPSFLVWDPEAFPNTTVHRPLLYYDQQHPLGPFDGRSELFSGPTQVHGVVWPEGTRSILYFGRHGTGPYCYGEGVDQNPPPPPRIINGQEHTYCYDPANADKGNHTYPYHYQVWAYDANDLLAVKKGDKDPWEPRPYAVWRLTLPFGIPYAEINGAAYDPTTKRIFLTQSFGDGAKPVIYVFRVG